MPNLVPEVWAAVLTHRTANSCVDRDAMRRNCRLLASRGVTGVVLNGATGEYPATTVSEFREILGICHNVLGVAGSLIAGIGADSLDATVALGEIAFEAGVAAVLLPPPLFFRYSQDDVAEWCRAIAARVSGPVVLYNLPQFTNSFELATVLALLESSPNIKGVKDSSGSLEILRVLTRTGSPDIRRIVGNDQVLLQACRERVCNGVISGVAGVIPELTMYLAATDPTIDEYRYQVATSLLDEYIGQIQQFPVPWGLKWTAQYRGLAAANFLQPVSALRRQQGAAFLEWFDDWWDRAESTLDLVTVGT